MRFCTAIILFLFVCLNAAAYQLGMNIKSEPVNLSELNTKNDDFAPRWNAWEKKLYFNSISGGSSAFYTSDYSDGLFGSPVLVKSPINRRGDSRSYIAFISQNEALLGAYHNFKRRPFVNLHTSIYVKNGWSEPELISAFQRESFVSHPTVSPTGDLLVFVSDMDNPAGDTDLWMSWKTEDNIWSMPIRLDELNSHGNEITPFLLSSDTLLFASDGYEGPGGFDLYYSVNSGGKWERPRPISDVNTEHDESDPAILNGNMLIFSSDRPGGVGGLDLYMAEIALQQAQFIVTDSPKLNIMSQVANIGITKHTNRFDYPAINFIPKTYIDNIFLHGERTSNFFYDYLKSLFRLMQKNTEIELMTETNEHGRRLCEIMNNWGIEPHRTKTSIPNADVHSLEIAITNCTNCNLISDGNIDFSIKPEMLDIGLSGVNLPNEYSLNFKTKFNNESKIVDLPYDTLPMRFLFPVIIFTDQLYDSDELDLILDLSINGNINSSVTKKLPITRSEESGNLTVFHENRIYRAYPIPCFEGQSVVRDENIDSYLSFVAKQLNSKNRIHVFYTEAANLKYAREIAMKLSAKTGIKNIRPMQSYVIHMPMSFDSLNSVVIGIAD